jgi:hypothetical protein
MWRTKLIYQYARERERNAGRILIGKPEGKDQMGDLDVDKLVLKKRM